MSIDVLCSTRSHLVVPLSSLKKMANRSSFLILTLCCYFFCNTCYSETDTLLQGQELKDWDYLISSNKVFTLKFFGFGTTTTPYLGIFYNLLRHQMNDFETKTNPYLETYDHLGRRRLYASDVNDSNKAVWVANRNNPSTDTYGKLMIDIHGKLGILSDGGPVFDLFSPTTPVTINASATLLNNGNFVLQELYPDGSVNRVLWQSFDYPTDTLLPGMKLGINLKTGHRWSLTSWWSETVPADGSFTLTIDSNSTGQMVIRWRGKIHWRSGSWHNGGFENSDLLHSGPDVRLYYVSNEAEQSFMYLTKTYDSSPSLTMNLDGKLKGSLLKLDVLCDCSTWDSTLSGCAVYEKFEWLDCRRGYRHEFWKTYSNKYGDEYVYDESYNLTLYDCQRLCWNNCSCMAYIYATTNRATCKTYGQNLYNAKDEPYRRYYAIVYRGGHGAKKVKKWIWFMIGIGSLIAIFLSCYFLYKKIHIKGKSVIYATLFVFLKVKKIPKLLLHRLRHLFNYIRTDKKMNSDVHYFTFQSISSATNNFSTSNKLGEGGFGAVYKGKLVDGQEIAVKRLSTSSDQGVKEFKNETELIAKLQHTNLVRLLGCCTDKKEKILVYEYMSNKSLDFFLFDPTKKGLLDWNNRFIIIDGIAQGLLYLHKFSRLRVIHRDLKASNILLDDYLKPKISDFGMAKLFGINESEANTSRVVGTRGYMPPEYMMKGTVSTKTDVFSFGVLLLEIVSSKMNHGTYDAQHPLNLLGLAWEMWNEGRGLELMDPVLEDSCTPKEVMTCIHVGLLCVQDNAIDRPTMSEVISMLTNENMHLPEPKRPAFFIERHEADSATNDNMGNSSVNGQSISILVAR